MIADGWDVLRNRPALDADVHRHLFREHGPVAATPLMVEEFVPADSVEGRLPVEYKCHAFGDTIAAVQVIERAGPHAGIQRYYTSSWEPFVDVMDTDYSLAPLRAPPRSLGEMLDAARRLSTAIGTYMRIDFFDGAAGAVFNEFSSTPQVRTLLFTPHFDEMLGALWQQRFPDAV